MKGSEWNKWDLHLHSPATWLANRYSGNCDFPAFVKKINEKQLTLIGLTNYFFFQKNELESVRDEIANQGLSITVLGNVEFRLDQQNKQDAFINVHVLFSERLSTERINSILSRLPLKLTDGSGRTIYCCEEDVQSSGQRVDTIVVDLSQLLEHLNSSLILFKDFIVAVCPNGYGGFRPDSTGRSQALATWIDRQGHIVFGSQRDREFYLTTSRYEGALTKPVFHCSDAHDVNDIGRNYTWVKALPTFEGLRQSMLEPASRLQLGNDWPERRIPKVHFSNIEVEGTIFEGQAIRFKKIRIPLNPDMVAIIGGRGTGKSLLLDALRSCFTGASTRGSEQRDIRVERIEIELDKADGNTLSFNARTDSYDYLHVSQGAIKTLCQQPSLISDEIKKMLRLVECEIPESLRNEIDARMSAYRSFREYYNIQDVNGVFINTIECQKEIIRISQEKISTLTSEKNKTLIERFQANSVRSTALKKGIEAGNNVLRVARSAQAELNERLSEMNSISSGVVPVPPLDFTELNAGVTSYVAALNEQSLQVDQDNLRIMTEFREQGIDQDISGVLEKIKGYQEQIQTSTLKINEINHRIAQYNDGVRQRGVLGELIIQQILGQEKSINESFSMLAEKTHLLPEQQELITEILHDIRIYGCPHFDVKLFYIGVLERLNRGKFRTSAGQDGIERVAQFLGVRNIHDLLALMRGEKIIECPDEPGVKISLESLLWKSEYFNSQGPYALISFIFSPDLIATYLKVRAEFEYKGKTVEKLSAGQRGTFYVCLKLATDAFGSPFVFDQPEDDLDNEFIMHQLVPLFRKIKFYRQVIIVTHNANLVVNCDAEQVIVASNEGEVISYRSGALEYGEHGEDNSIRKAICDVLEGGKYAFEAREQKYGML